MYVDSICISLCDLLNSFMNSLDQANGKVKNVKAKTSKFNIFTKQQTNFAFLSTLNSNSRQRNSFRDELLCVLRMTNHI